MKFLIFLPFFLLGCATDTFFVSKSVLKEIKQRCSNLSIDIQKEIDRLITRDDHLVREYRRIMTSDVPKRGKLIHLGKELISLREETSRFMEDNKSVFVDCSGEEKFNLFIKHVLLLEEGIKLDVETNHLYVNRNHLAKEANRLKEEIGQLVARDNRLAIDGNSIFEELNHLKEKGNRLWGEGIRLVEEANRVGEEYDRLKKTGEQWERANQLLAEGNHLIKKANRLLEEANQLLEKQNHIQKEFIRLAN